MLMLRKKPVNVKKIKRNPNYFQRVSNRGVNMNTNRIWMALCIILSFSGIIACAAKPALNIQYDIPDSTKKLEGIKVGIVFIDQRSDRKFLDKAAKEQLNDFTGKFVLLTEPGNKTEKDNLLDASELFQKTLRKRLEGMGVTVSQNPDEADGALTLIVKTFELNFVDGSWKAKIAYEAQLLTGDDIRAREEISGSAERVKIIGTGDADKVLSKLFTDVINQLNLENMFEKAGLG